MTLERPLSLLVLDASLALPPPIDTEKNWSGRSLQIKDRNILILRFENKIFLIHSEPAHRQSPLGRPEGDQLSFPFLRRRRDWNHSDQRPLPKKRRHRIVLKVETVHLLLNDRPPRRKISC